ncbi:hypothetical protein KL864_34480 [Mycolicibacterium goodii]|uniref:hypothetical protein n=1 Tax=Mycolicibacterium goodii TaxID=134601 RepID=UPI001BDCB86F|nr:hypothetical protein [Mycolicibacterium goodii]MBU8820969.1 hypothetical protein [Mycolicibacterium goodii]
MWANWVLAPLKLIDRNGAQVIHYRLFLDGGWGPGEFFAWITSDVLFLAVIIPAAYSSQLIEFAINPAIWLTPIEKAWTTVLGGLFAFISPTVLLAAVLLAVLVVIAVRSRNSDEALKAIVQRTVASMGMYVLILALLYNPAGTLRNVLTGWVRLLGGFTNDAAAIVNPSPTGAAQAVPAGEIGDVVADGTDSSVLTNFLRPLTWMLNYGSQLSPECAKQWARLVELGEPMSCLTASQIEASQSVGVAFIMTLFALVPVFIYCRFAVVVILTFATHLVLAIVRFALAAAMAAVSPWQDRPFDEFMRFMVSAVANLVVASGIVTIARLGPQAAVSIAESITDSTLVHFAVLVAAYYMLTMFVWTLEKQFGPIRNWLLNAASNAKPSAQDQTSRWWSLAFPGGLNPQGTALDRLIATARQRGSQWAAQTREQVKQMANDKLQPAPALTEAMGPLAAAVTAGTVPDTPRTIGAMTVVNTIDDQVTRAETPPVVSKVQSILNRLADRHLPALPNPPHRPRLSSESSTTTGLTAAAIDNSTPAPLHQTTADATSPVTYQSPPGQGLNDLAESRLRWRARLNQDAGALATSTSGPQLLSSIDIDNDVQAVSTLSDERGNALEPLDPTSTPATYLARISYMEIIMRAMGWEGTIDSHTLLPPGTTFFTSGIDESGNWVTEFHA